MYDVVVIGGGPGGYAAAIRASQLGGKVALVEADRIGGTCVNRGCIPSKIWLRAAELYHQISRAQAFGIDASVNGLNLNAIAERKNGVAGDIRMGMEGLLKSNRVELIKGHAVLKDSGAVDIDGTRVDAKRIIIATGSCPDIPNVPGLEKSLFTIDHVFEMDKIPASILIWGAGPVELEMATLLNRFDCNVQVAFEDARILPLEDGETSQRITQALRADGVEIFPRYRLESVKKSKNGIICNLSGRENRVVEVEKILVCARKANTAHLALEKIGIETNQDGSIRVNERLETANSSIYAVGDVTGGWMLSHAASAMAITAAENAMGQNNRFPFEQVPRGIWSCPEVGAVGLTEEEAEKKGYDIDIGDFPYSINGLAMAQDQLKGAVKIISDKQYGGILGVHVVGAGATELVGEAVLAMQLEATVSEFSKNIRVHPTFSETLVEAARSAANWALYLPNR